MMSLTKKRSLNSMEDYTPRVRDAKEKMGAREWKRKASVGRVSVLSGWSVAGLQQGWWCRSWVWLCVNRSEHADSPLRALSPYFPLSLSLLSHPVFHCNSLSFPSSPPSSFFAAHALALSLWCSPPAWL